MRILPFKPGDKVVCVSGDPYFSPDIVYTVRDCWFCCEKSGYRVPIEEVQFPIQDGCCITCGGTRKGWWTSNFRKVDDISDTTVNSLLKELYEPVRELQPA